MNTFAGCVFDVRIISWLIACIGLTSLISECQALQDLPNPSLKQARDPYYNPRVQTEASPVSPGAERRMVNPLYPLKKDNSQIEHPVEKHEMTKSDGKSVQTLPKWEPPIPKSSAMANPAKGNANGNPLKPVPSSVINSPAATSSLVPNSIIRNSTNNAPREIVRDYSADLTQLNRSPRTDATRASFDAGDSNPVGSNPGGPNPGGLNPGGLNPGGLNPGGLNPGGSKAGEFKPVSGPDALAMPEIKSFSSTNKLIPNKPIPNSSQLGGKPSLPEPKDTNRGISKNNTSEFEPGVDQGKSKSSAGTVPATPNSSAGIQPIKPGNSDKSTPISSSNPNLEPTRLLAMVGNEPIFVGDVLFELNQMIERHMVGAPEAIKERERQNGISMLLKKYIDAKLLYIDTLRKLPEGADVEKIIDQAAQEFDKTAAPTMMKEAGIKSLADFDAYLRLQGTSLRKLRLHWSKDQLTRYFMSQELEFDKEVSHRELLEEYQKNRASYAIPAKARWEQITVRFDKTASREEAERMLVDMGNKIVYGANFASVAKKGSHGFMASNGGLHDWIGKNELASKELDKAIFSEEIGKLSDKIETAEGLHIIRVLERTEDSYTPFVDAQVKIKEELLNRKRAEVFEKHLAQLRQEIPVVRYDQEESPSVRVAEKSNR